ncbi:MAG: hypothetical protein CL565_04515 [Alphaproteobacteria bacterium]|nr:hypothetical protein [Alphaproteobacteria bacterium]|tara:strand:+ start:445 stop:1656 length:1212 start_codon:yes stop_codon:yes gene_type:complete
MDIIKNSSIRFQNTHVTWQSFLLAIFAVLSPRAIGTIFPLLCLIAALPFLRKLSFKEYFGLFAPAIIISAIAALSVFWSISPDDSLERVVKTLPLLFLISLIPLGFYNYETHFDSKRLLRLSAYILTCAFLLIGMDFLLNGRIYLLLHGEEYTGYFNRSNYNRSLVSLFLLSLPTLYFLQTLNLKRYFFSLSGCIFLLALLSESQSLQIGLMVFFTAFLLSHIKLPWLYILAAGISIIVIALPWFMPYLYEANPTFLKNYISSAYPLQRIEIWSNVSIMIQEKPWIGHGIETLRSVTFPTSLKYLKDDTVLHSHNIYLQIWYEFGALGILVFLGLFWAGVMKIASLGKSISTRLFFCLLAPAILISMVSYGLWQAWYLVVNSYAIILAYQLCRKVQRHDFQKS